MLTLQFCQVIFGVPQAFATVLIQVEIETIVAYGSHAHLDRSELDRDRWFLVSEYEGSIGFAGFRGRTALARFNVEDAVKILAEDIAHKSETNEQWNDRVQHLGENVSNRCKKTRFINEQFDVTDILSRRMLNIEIRNEVNWDVSEIEQESHG